MKYLIIGGVAGGATAAARIRRLDEQGTIVLIEKGAHISYANCGLPYYIGGVIALRDRLFVQTPEGFSRRFNADVRAQQEVVGIDTTTQTVTVRKTDGTTYTESYDRLLLSPGAEPVRPPLPGINSEGVFTLRNVADTDAIKNFINTQKPTKALVVGGGFIGLEMAENLHAAGLHVHLVEMGKQVMAPVDFSVAAQLHHHLTEKGVALHLETAVTGITPTASSLNVQFNDGNTLQTDMVILSIGVRPNVTLAREAGITVGEKGIAVNEFLQTSAPHVYAVGDAIAFPHPLTGKPWLNYLAGPANRQARIAADNMVNGNTLPYEGAVGTAIAKVFNLTVGTTGLAAKHLRAAGLPYLSSTTWTANHAGYYPGASLLMTKVTFHPASGKLLGVQCVGADGVDKRIDVAATIIKRGGTIADLMQLEQAYAPPFSSAKDALAIAGYVANNVLTGQMPVIYWRDMADLHPDTLVVDVRTPEEFTAGHIDGAKNIPVDDLRSRLSELPREKDIVLYCAVGLRGYVAQRILMGHGYTQVRNLSGGYRTYSAAVEAPGCPEQKEETTPSAPPSIGQEEHMQLVDACGLQCPGPILQLKKAVDALPQGGRVTVKATDPGFPRDARAWCNSTGNTFLSHSEANGTHQVIIQKTASPIGIPLPGTLPTTGGGKTFIMFSDDLDRALATFVLANGAAATGAKVSVFFTFWGLNVIKRERKPKIKKDFFSSMFALMMPSHSKRLHLSQMSMWGMGDKLMRFIMRKKGIDSLESLRTQALENGVEFIACQMSMDMMGIAKEELIDGVTIGGVATYMERAGGANVNLFI